MSTHDYVIDNQSAPAIRADLNSALQAIVTQNASATAPTVTYPNMIWYDTANNQIKKRNEADSAWITLGTVDEGTGLFNPNMAFASQAEAEAGTDNTKSMTPLRAAQAIAALGGLSGVNQQAFTSSGTYTPTAGYKFAIAIVTGGGAGADGASSSSNSNGAGGAGATTIGTFSLSGLAAQAVTIGAGGVASSSGPVAGGTSSIGSIITAGGAPNTGLGGTTGTGGLVVPGADGGNAGGEVGGGSFWGGGGDAGSTSSSGGAGKAYGAGGGSPNSPSSGSLSGGNGKAGVVLIWEFK